MSYFSSDYTLAIFDIDDTLVQTAKLLRETRIDAICALETSLEPEKALAIWQQLSWYMDVEQVSEVLKLVEIELLGERKTSDRVLEQIAEDYRKEDESLKRLEPVPYAHTVLVTLQDRNVTLAIVSNGDTAYQMKKLHVTDLIKFFKPDAIFIAKPDTPTAKPMPEGLRTIMKTLQITPDQTICVGDRRTDVIAGKLAGIKHVVQFVGSPSLEAHEPEKINTSLETPDRKILSLEELLEYR